MGQQLQHAEPEGHSQSRVVWLEKHNHGINLVVASKKGQDVVEVLFVLLNATTIANARGVNQVEPCGVCLNHILPRKLGSRLPTDENLIRIRTNFDFYSASFFIGENKSETF